MAATNGKCREKEGIDTHVLSLALGMEVVTLQLNHFVCNSLDEKKITLIQKHVDCMWRWLAHHKKVHM